MRPLSFPARQRMIDTVSEELLSAHLMGVWGGTSTPSSSDRFFFGVLSTCDLNAGKDYWTSSLSYFKNSTWRKKGLHLDFRCKNSLVSIEKHSSVNVSALEVVFFILLVDIIHLGWKSQQKVTRGEAEANRHSSQRFPIQITADWKKAKLCLFYTWTRQQAKQ